MNRIEEKILFLKNKRKKAFVGYITAGFPDINKTAEIVMQLEKNGVDIIELGMPFSDPVADGPTIQKSSSLSLQKGMSLNKFLGIVKEIRKKTQIPLIIMSYYNPIFNYGTKKFALDAKRSGLDGVIIPDLPPEESNELNGFLKTAGIFQIFLISPVTTAFRMKKIAKQSDGFVYYVSLTGVTGTRKTLPLKLKAQLKLLKKITAKNIFVGFGISTPQQAKNVLKNSAGIIIGSAIIKILLTKENKRVQLQKLSEYIQAINKVTFY